MAREPVTREKLAALMVALAREVTGPGRIYFTGGASALLHGWREMTVDVDLSFGPEPPGIFEAIRDLKDELDVNVELASRAQFVPALPGWQARSPPIARHGVLDFHHYDFYSQALSKIERGHGRDLDDVRAMIESGLVEPAELLALFEEARDALVRYPSIDAEAFESRLRGFLAGFGPHDG